MIVIFMLIFAVIYYIAKDYKKEFKDTSPKWEDLK